MTVVIIPGVDCVSGSYTDSVGIDNIRKDVASYISKRDGGIASNHTDIFLCGGASDGIKVLPHCSCLNPCPYCQFLSLDMFIIGLLVYIGGYILHGMAHISLILFYPNWLHRLSF